MTDALDIAMRRVVEVSRYLHEIGLTHGSTGNVSVRVGDEIVVTPTGKSLRSLRTSDLALITMDGQVRSQARPSKEAVLHAAVYRSRPDATSIIHTHSLYATAVSCLAGLDMDDALPPLTAYYAMRVGKLPVVPFYPPGDSGLAEHAGRVAVHAHSMLMRNHGALVAAGDLDQAVDVIEELEQTAQLYLLLDGKATSPVDPTVAQQLYQKTYK